MELLHEYLFAHPLLSLAQTAFMVWMLVDAYQRRAEQVWFLVILFVPFFGAWAYFFVVKARDFRGFNLASLFQRRASLDELRYQTQQAPTLANHLDLARRLMEMGLHAEAVGHLEAVLKREPEHLSALFALATCHDQLGSPQQAVPLLEKLVAREPRWSEFQAWHVLIECRQEVGNAVGALEAGRELVRLAPILRHQCLLAESLLAAGKAEEARGLLSRALQDYAFAPSYVRRRDRRWAGEAGRLQKQLALKS